MEKPLESTPLANRVSPAAALAPAPVALVPCRSYDEAEVTQALKAALELMGGWEPLFPPEGPIYLKPNLAGPFPPERGVTTHPAVVKAVARLLQAAGREVVVGDSPAGPARPRLSDPAGVHRTDPRTPVGPLDRDPDRDRDRDREELTDGPAGPPRRPGRAATGT